MERDRVVLYVIDYIIIHMNSGGDGERESNDTEDRYLPMMFMRFCGSVVEDSRLLGCGAVSLGDGLLRLKKKKRLFIFKSQEVKKV